MRARRALSLAFAAGLITGAVFAAPAAAQQWQQPPASPFPHEKHAKVFPLCTACHAGVTEPDRPMFPEAAQCAACHDSVVVKSRVEWQPRVGPRVGNRRFTHEAHNRAAVAKNPADTALIRTCSACHTEAGTPRMAVKNAIIGQCLDCHKLTEPHVDNPSAACATCHVRLTDASTLRREDIERFPKPQSHREAGFLLGGHGKAATMPGSPTGALAIAASCATCHARNLCIGCHVNAPESRVILALAFDDRAPIRLGGQPVPGSHKSAGFLLRHGRDAQRSTASCATCHTRESCTTCHVKDAPRAVTALAAAAEGRAQGAQISRIPPSSHTREFRERHAIEANGRPTSCETCHTRSMCLECHRPAAGTRQASHHPLGFLTRHPSAAFSRAANCSDCHNPAQFCQSCHQKAGLTTESRIGQKGYHDAFRGFSLGHGQAARQSLESCVSCHTERNCTACHSAVGGGFRFNPHGPGFDAARMKTRNPSMCMACHGRVIP